MITTFKKYPSFVNAFSGSTLRKSIDFQIEEEKKASSKPHFDRHIPKKITEIQSQINTKDMFVQ